VARVLLLNKPQLGHVSITQQVRGLGIALHIGAAA
jgi:hypothetical protein